MDVIEIWKDIEIDSIEFEYQVSNLGNMRSMNYNRTGKVQNLKIRVSASGNRCALFAGNTVRSIAPIVLETFAYPRPTSKHIPFHINGDPSNDCINNLVWRLISKVNLENVNKAKANGNFKTPFVSKKVTLTI